ncbi:MAG: type II toxin-antitoxin system RelE/ParE family toxin [Bacteroidota bacterium]
MLEEAREFLESLDQKTRSKILFNIRKARGLNDPELLKKITGVLWEFRTTYNGIQYRLLAFWDRSKKIETIVISTHGFLKRTDKVPFNEINKALQIRQHYFDQKKTTA